MSQNDNYSEWTSCEFYGHCFNIDGEIFDSCIDCGEKREC